MTEPCHLSAIEARRLIGSKKLSPVELLDSCLKRIAKTNKAINAIVALDEKRARRVAKEQEKAVMRGDDLGLLHGLPIGVKDLDATEGLRTTWGSLLFKDHVPDADNAMVANVRAAGGIILAKTNAPEFGAGGNTTNPVYGATGNPFDPRLTSGGSSGGAAAALALDMVPLATGSDDAGSMRTPSAYCGTVGFRPSPGIVPATGKPSALMAFGVLGPMARSVQDAHLLLRAQCDLDRRDPFSSSDAFEIPEQLEGADISSLRVAFTPDFGVCPVDKQIVKVFKARMKVIGRSLARLDEATPDFSGVHDTYRTLRSISYVAGHQDKVEKSRKLLQAPVLDSVDHGLSLTASQIGRAFTEQQSLMCRVLEFFEQYDVLIAPVAAVSPYPHTEPHIREIAGVVMSSYISGLSLVYAPTAALCCACVIPCGVDHLGLPFGIQIIGPKGADALVLEVAHALEQVLAADPETARPIPKL